MPIQDKDTRTTIYGQSRSSFDTADLPTTGQRLAFALTENQTFPVTLITEAGEFTQTDWDIVAVNVDNINTFDLNGLVTVSVPYVINPDGALDRWRNNGEQTIFGATPRTATVDSADYTNFNWRGLHLVFNVSAITATPSVVVKIQGKDDTFDNYYDLLVSTAITTTGITILKIYPGIGQITNGAASDILPRVWRIRVEHANADSITYTAVANLVV